MAIQDQSPEHAQIYRFFVFKLAKDYDHQSYSKRKEEDSLDSMASSGDLTNLIEAINNTHGMEISDEDPIIKKYMNQHDSNYRSFIRRIEVCMARVIRQHEEKISHLQTKAAEVTSSSMVAQDSFRKSFLMGLRDQLASDVSSRETLVKIIQSLTHERAIWGKNYQSR